MVGNQHTTSSACHDFDIIEYPPKGIWYITAAVTIINWDTFKYGLSLKEKKNAYALGTPRVIALTVVFLHRLLALLYYDDTSYKNIFLTWWPWPLTYDLDLWSWARYSSTWPTCQNSSLYVCLFAVRAWQTDTQMQTHRMTRTSLYPHRENNWNI